jgi:hypothetical protein
VKSALTVAVVKHDVKAASHGHNELMQIFVGVASAL